MTTADERTYLLELAKRSVLGSRSESDAYGVVNEVFILHKKPMDRYMIFPPWKPNSPFDKRAALPDFGIGRCCDTPPFVRFQGGALVKASIPDMVTLPPPAVISELVHVKDSLLACAFQAEEQAKAAVEGGYLPADQQIPWLIFIGPYFTTIKLSPLTTAQLQIRGDKTNDSGDFRERVLIEMKKSQAPPVYPLYLLGTEEAANEIEKFLTSTTF